MRVFRFKPLSFKQGLSHFILFFLCFFLVLFPKAGIKVSQIPITWGYLFLGFITCFTFFRKTYRINHRRLAAFYLCLPFQLFSLFVLVFRGIDSIGFFLSFFLSFLLLPFIFFLTLSEYIEKMDLSFFFKVLKFCIFFVAVYGIFLFFYKLLTGKFIEIPFLTVNYHDIGELENKNINRGFVFKLISTYNNGNLYGISLLILYPLYLWLEKSFLKKNLVLLSLILTFSRTVWAGLIFSEIFYFLWIERKQLKLFFTLIFLITLLLFSAIHFQFSWLFFWDTSLGGRLTESYFNPFTFFGTNEPFMYLNEMVYPAILYNFGIFGLLFFISAILAPLFLSFSQKDPLKKCLKLGLITFLFVCLSDGAILLIPVMCFYWFISSLLLRKNSCFFSSTYS